MRYKTSGGRSGDRTRTDPSVRQILSLLWIPISPSGHLLIPICQRTPKTYNKSSEVSTPPSILYFWGGERSLLFSRRPSHQSRKPRLRLPCLRGFGCPQ